MRRTTVLILLAGGLLWSGIAIADDSEGGQPAEDAQATHLFDDLNADGASDGTPRESASEDERPSEENEDSDQTPLPDPVEES
jgi:hypothetical protein